MGLWQETWCHKSSVRDMCHTYSTVKKKNKQKKQKTKSITLSKKLKNPEGKPKKPGQN